MTQFFLLISAFLLILANGFFVAAEFAMVKLRGTRVVAIKESHPIRGKILENIHRHIDSYLSACQLGITLTSLGLGWIGEPTVAKLLEPLLHGLGIFSKTTITIISFTVAFCIIAIFHIVLGELVPKSIAIRKPEVSSLWTSIPLYWFYRMMYPAIWMLNFSANIILKMFGVKTEEIVSEKEYSPEEFKLILTTGSLREAFSEQEVAILKQVIDFTDVEVGDLSNPVEELISVSIETPIQTILDLIALHRYSRYPLWEEESDNMIGLLHIKDLLVMIQKKQLEDINLRELSRPLVIAYNDQLASELFEILRKGPAHFAVVKNKRENVVGFITLDDILIDLFGNIRDEFNKMKPEWIKTERGNLLMKGNTSIYALEKALNIEIKTPAHTISGLLMSRLERLPDPKEKIDFPDFTIIVQRMQGPKILFVKVHPKNKSKDEGDK